MNLDREYLISACLGGGEKGAKQCSKQCSQLTARVDPPVRRLRLHSALVCGSTGLWVVRSVRSPTAATGGPGKQKHAKQAQRLTARRLGATLSSLRPRLPSYSYTSPTPFPPETSNYEPQIITWEFLFSRLPAFAPDGHKNAYGPIPKPGSNFKTRSQSLQGRFLQIPESAFPEIHVRLPTNGFGSHGDVRTTLRAARQTPRRHSSSTESISPDLLPLLAVLG